MTLDRHSTLRGITLGLWVLTGLAFLAEALLPGIGRFPLLAPWLLATSIGWVALIPNRENLTRLPASRVLLLAGFVLALATSFVLIRDGDRRSLLFAGFASLATLLLHKK
ncbi:MAG: hypothetical protein G01um101438_532 [Parcubacteria group bacterium Gr01-1014_38]|nr:MAG: hypothetical protein G01um101438_532 [Parcubacteria group bacterium Gr01-1014_38]